MYTKEEIKTDLLYVQQMLNKVPTKIEYVRHGKYSVDSIRKTFGNWTDAVIEVFSITPRNNRTNEPKQIISCLNCGKDTTNSKFCSRDCTNKYDVKEKIPTGECKKCGVIVYSVKKICPQCSNSNKDITLAEAIYTNHHPSSAYALIRTRARAIAKELEWNSCIACGYDKHIEIAHRKAISDYPLDTLLPVINAESQLIPICPRCHWEFDNGLLILPEV